MQKTRTHEIFNSTRFLSSNHEKISLWCMFYCLTMKGKAKHHQGNKKSKCQVATLKRYYVYLSNGKENAIYTSRHRAIVMQLYNWRWWKPKWKNSKTSNDKTQSQPNACEVRARKGMELRWSQGFRLDELDVWQTR